MLLEILGEITPERMKGRAKVKATPSFGLSALVSKEENSVINNLSFHLGKLEKEVQ